MLDLHALRHTCGTWLGNRADVNPKTVQEFMRHRDFRFTFRVYVHRDDRALAAAANVLPKLGSETPPVAVAASA